MTEWNVRTPGGALVTDLKALAGVLDTSEVNAAWALLGDASLASVAPTTLLEEVKAATKPGGGTPPPISSGSFVSWDGGKGRVDLIVTNGKVPGIEDDVEGTDKTPAARVVVWEDGKATGKKIGASTAKLKRIPPIKPAASKKGDPAEELVSIVSAQDSRVTSLRLPEHRRITGEAVKSVYDRGLAGWPGEAKTSLSREDWALGRVNHFVKVANGEIAMKSRAGHDLDLLAEGHPLAPATETKDTVTVDFSTFETQVKSLLDAATDD